MNDIVKRLIDRDTSRRPGENYADVCHRRQKDRDDAADTITHLRAENERLKAALKGMIDLAEFWITQGFERGMSKERYEIWLATGHRSKSMQAARAALTKEESNG